MAAPESARGERVSPSSASHASGSLPAAVPEHGASLFAGGSCRALLFGKLRVWLSLRTEQDSSAQLSSKKKRLCAPNIVHWNRSRKMQVPGLIPQPPGVNRKGAGSFTLELEHRSAPMHVQRLMFQTISTKGLVVV